MGRLTATHRAHHVEVMSALDAALGRHGEGVIVLGPDGRVVVATTQAKRLAAAHLGVRVSAGRPLPPAVGPRAGRLQVRSEPDDGNGYRFVVLHETSAAVTAREAEVLDLLASGRTSAEVAAQLGISARTVDKHVEHLREKLGVHNRTAALARWLM